MSTRFVCCLSDPNPKVVEIPATLEQIDDWQKGRKAFGEALPNLSTSEIDFMMYGLYSENLKEIKDGSSMGS